MLESMGSLFNRMDQINKRIETISKIPSRLPIRRIQPYRESVNEDDNTKTQGPKFSEVLQEVLNRKNGNINSSKVDEVVGNKNENAALLKTLYSISQRSDSNLTTDQIIAKASSKYGVNSDLVRAIIQQESGFSPSAVSPKGAMGLMQLMPRTADLLGVKDAMDPYENIMAGTRYFKMLLDKYDGDIGRSLAAYNAGAHRVDLEGGIPNIRETTDYVRKVIGLYRQYSMQHEAEE